MSKKLTKNVGILSLLVMTSLISGCETLGSSYCVNAFILGEDAKEEDLQKLSRELKEDFVVHNERYAKKCH
jgi:hypothetical protein